MRRSRGRGFGEQGRGDGRSYLKPELPAHRTLTISIEAALIREFMPEVFKQSEGRFWVDYGFHLAPIEAGHIEEMEHLVSEHGVTSFKIFIFTEAMACTDARRSKMIF